MATIPAEHLGPSNISIGTPEERERVFGHLRDELADPPVPTPEAIANFHRMAVPQYPELVDYNPLLMWDLSIARRVMDEGA